MQEIYSEINRYNQFAVVSGKPVFRCVNMYRWCQCDGWNIDGADDLYEDTILSDLDQAGRARGVIVPTVDEALEFIRAAGE